MKESEKTFNIVKELKGLDLVYFPDSTCLRAWGNEKDVDILQKRLRKYPGKIYTKKNKEGCPISFKREYSGDLLFIANPGTIIFPDFFNSFPPKAMHGYDKTNKLYALFICNKKLIKREKISNIDICPVILKELKINKPVSWKGHSY